MIRWEITDFISLICENTVGDPYIPEQLIFKSASYSLQTAELSSGQSDHIISASFSPADTV